MKYIYNCALKREQSVPASKRYASSKDKSLISLSFTNIWRSPLLHLQRRGCHEMERCIGRQSSLERSRASFRTRMKIKTVRRSLHGPLQPLVPPAITVSIAKKSMKQFIYCAQCRNKKTPSPHKNSPFKELRLLKNTLYSWVFGLPLSSVLKLMSVAVKPVLSSPCTDSGGLRS